MNDKGCPSCGQVMKVRSGKFGEFYFCPDQAICGQATIAKPALVGVTSCNPDIGIINTSTESLVYELRILEAEQSPLFRYSEDDEPFINELGEPVYEYGEDFRPHG